MKLLYTTDLHGIEWKYERIFQEANTEKVDLVINGGDMLPFKGNLLNQGSFIENYLDKHFSEYNKAKIYYLSMLANDDLRIFDDLFQNTCAKYPLIINIAQNKFELNNSNYEFIGMNWVTDLPFGLKDRARKDTKNFKYPRQIGKPVLSVRNGWQKIENWFAYANNLPTIEDELKDLIKPFNMKNTIYIFHQPPSNLELDICSDGSTAGSMAIYEFLKNNQPLLSLHGHIHESPATSGTWYSSIERTVCIQPGQSHQFQDFLVYVIIELDKMIFERKIIIKNNE
jgi:Icc-related predicted phosphoesterase